MTYSEEARRRLGVYLERDRLRAGLTQRQVADELGIKSVKTVYAAESGTWTGDEPPPATKRLAARWGWMAEGVYRVLGNEEPPYSTDVPKPAPMARAVKDEWRRRVENSDMSTQAKRETLDLIDSIPDAD